MSKLNEDVLFLILEELQNDGKSLYSCLLVDKTWCETTIPILWKNPFKFRLTDNAKNVLFNVILLHLSKESKENLKNQEFDLFTETHKRPLFNYISYCKYLNLHTLENIIAIKKLQEPKISIIRNEILRLFINGNTKIAHLDINSHYQLHLIPGVEHCLSELKSFQCYTIDNDQNVLEELPRISQSIEVLGFFVSQSNNNSGIIKLIEAQRNLINVRFTTITMGYNSFYKIFEELLIKHADTIQYLQIYWKPVTEFLSHLTNLISLEINSSYMEYTYLDSLNWGYLENASLPALKILKARGVPSKSLAIFIENTKGNLTEISIDYHHDGYNDDGNSKRLIQAIYQNCPNLKYVKLYLNVNNNSNISELEKLLTNCQCLIGLIIASLKFSNWDNLFETLAKSSPTGLFKFKLCFEWYGMNNYESLKFFFDSWKGRHPMLLQTVPTDLYHIRIGECFDLIEKYKAEGIIKKYDNDLCGNKFEEFEWIHKKL